jgi:hypothetical protein
MPWEVVLACAAAFAAGAVNAVAGGGTLPTFPSLLALVSPVSANATSTMALLPGSLSAAFGFRAELRRRRRTGAAGEADWYGGRWMADGRPGLERVADERVGGERRKLMATHLPGITISLYTVVVCRGTAGKEPS